MVVVGIVFAGVGVTAATATGLGSAFGRTSTLVTAGSALGSGIGSAFAGGTGAVGIVAATAGSTWVSSPRPILRGVGTAAGVDAANPRVNNVFGHIVRWLEKGGDAASSAFTWNLFTLAGDPQHPEAEKRGNVKGDAFGSPDGIWVDGSGLVWIQTDVSSSTIGKGHYERLGNNQMLCADTHTGEVRRFLTGPRGCEVTGIAMTPDRRTMFINIQHPGESPSERSDPANPKAYSTWPDGAAGGRPRSGTVAIRKDDGGVIGS